MHEISKYSYVIDGIIKDKAQEAVSFSLRNELYREIIR